MPAMNPAMPAKTAKTECEGLTILMLQSLHESCGDTDKNRFHPVLVKLWKHYKGMNR